MTDHERRAAHYRAHQELPDDQHEAGDGEHESSADEGPQARQRRAEHTALWVEQQIRAAIARGEFDDLPYAGKPLPSLRTTHDPDWWLKGLIQREQITGVLPEALQLRTDDAGLDAELDRHGREETVRELLETFNARVLAARRQLTGGPPVITPLRDVEAEVHAWRERRRPPSVPRPEVVTPAPRVRRRWWSRDRA